MKREMKQEDLGAPLARLLASPEKRKKLAASARRLAMRCLTNGPEMTNNWCGCSIGLSLKGAGLWAGGGNCGDGLAYQLEGWFSGTQHAPGLHGILSEATRQRMWTDNPTAVVMPLLAFADALESGIATDAPQAPEKIP